MQIVFLGNVIECEKLSFRMKYFENLFLLLLWQHFKMKQHVF